MTGVTVTTGVLKTGLPCNVFADATPFPPFLAASFRVRPSLWGFPRAPLGEFPDTLTVLEWPGARSYMTVTQDRC